MTLNVQAGAASGSLTGVTCRFDFGDGFTSTSCNPGVHSYISTGEFYLNLEAKNQCGITLIQSQKVVVTPEPGASSDTVSSARAQLPAFDDSRVVISGVLPNPDSTDKDKEWIELKNLEDRTVSLAGWHFAVGIAKIHRFTIEDMLPMLAPHEAIRLYSIETGIELGNSTEKVELINPLGVGVSSVHWDKAREGQVYQSDAFRNQGLAGTVSRVIDPGLFEMALDAPSTLRFGSDTARVRLIGIRGLESLQDGRISLFQDQALAIVRSLIENKKVELFFDTEAWTGDGLLQAYVMIDDGRILQKELLLDGLAITDPVLLYASRQEYIEAQQKAISSKSGIWSIPGFSERKTAISALKSVEKTMIVASTSAVPVSTDDHSIIISEVFASPKSSAGTGNADDVARQEWLELYNPDDTSVDMQGWKLTSGKKSVSFASGSKIPAGGYLVVFAQKIGLKLKNAGDKVTLVSPSASYAVVLDYPKLRIGESYANDPISGLLCVMKVPTPSLPSTCRSALKEVIGTVSTGLKKKAKNSARPSARKSPYDGYAAEYRRSAQAGDIILADQTGSAVPSFILVIAGILV